MKRKSKIIVSILAALILIISGIFVYLKLNPLSAKTEAVEVWSFLSDDPALSSWFDEARNGSSEYQVFIDMNNLPSEHTEDYVQIIYYFSVKSHLFDSANTIRPIVSNISDNSDAFIFSPKLFPVQVDAFGNGKCQLNVIMYRGNLTDEQLEEKIRNVTAELLYETSGDSGQVEISGIESAPITYRQFDW